MNIYEDVTRTYGKKLNLEMNKLGKTNL